MISGKPFDFWVRESKRKNGGKFQLAGRFQYVSHTGSKPMRVIFERVEEYDPASVAEDAMWSRCYSYPEGD